jgi:hypothetical protein
MLIEAIARNDDALAFEFGKQRNSMSVSLLQANISLRIGAVLSQ